MTEYDEDGEPIPPPVLTPGVDSYITFDDAQAIAAARLFTTVWDRTPDSQLGRAIQAATALLDRMRWAGVRSSASQPLSWPRAWLRDEQGEQIPGDTIPPAIVTACAELAIHLLGAGQLPGGPAVQMRQLGDAMTMHFPHLADELPTHIRRLIEPFLAVRSVHVAEIIL